MNKASLVRVQKYLLLPGLIRYSRNYNIMYDAQDHFRINLLQCGFTRLALENRAWMHANLAIYLDLSMFPVYARLYGELEVSIRTFLEGAWGLRIDADSKSLRLREKALAQVAELEAIKHPLMDMHDWHYIGLFAWDAGIEEVCYLVNPGRHYNKYKAGVFPVSEFKKMLKNKGKILKK